MRIWEIIVSILTYPIDWFWTAYEQSKESKSLWKIVGLFVVSLTGLILFGATFIWLADWLITYHIDKVAIVGLIIWLYAYFKSKRDKKDAENKNKNEQQELQFQQEQVMAHEQAQRSYPLMRNIMYQTLKSYAENIGGVKPRLLQEIEVVDTHYVLANNICFYQFKLKKADMKMQYDYWDLVEFQIILQEEIARKLKNGEFPALGTQTYLDSSGILFDAVCIDVIEEIGQYFIIQAVFYSPAYADYWRSKEIDSQANSSDTTIPDAEWKDNK